MVTMRPCRQGSIRRSAAWTVKNVPLAFTAKTRSHSSDVTSRSGSVVMMPAHVTSPSIRPNSRSPSSKIASISGSRVTSACWYRTSPGSSAAVAFKRAASKSARTSRAPSRLAARAMAWPMPDAAPVMTMTWSRRFRKSDMGPPCSGQPRQVEAVHARGVAAHDLRLLGRRHAGEDFRQDLLRPRERRLAVGIVGAPHHVVDADHVAQADPDRVLLEAQDDVAVEKAAGGHAARKGKVRPLLGLAFRLVHRVEHVRGPRQLELHDGQREAQMTLEDAREDHVAHRRRRAEGLRGAAARVPERQAGSPADPALASRRRVKAERHAERLGGGPERLVLGLVVASVLEGKLADHRAGEAQARGPLQLRDAVTDVVEIDHRDALEPGGIRAAELGEPVVVRAEDRGHQPGILHPEIEQALRRVQHLARHPVEPHVREVLIGVVPSPMHVLEASAAGDGLRRLEPRARVRDEPDAGEDLIRLDDDLVGAVDPLDPGRTVAKRRVDSGRPQIGRLEDMRVGRQDRGGHHYVTSQPVWEMSKTTSSGPKWWMPL